MSRVRSQLDTLLDHPHRSPDESGYHRDGSHRDPNAETVQRKLDAAWAGQSAGAPRRSPEPGRQQRGETADLARIRDSLDRLAGRLGSLGASGSATEKSHRPTQETPYRDTRHQGSQYRSAPHQAASYPEQRGGGYSQHEPSRRAPERPAAPQQRRPEPDANDQIRNEMAALRNELVTTLGAFERDRGAGRMDEGTREELRLLVEAVSRLEQQSRQAPAHLQDVTAELHDVREALRQLSGNLQPGLDGLTRSIETNYADLAGRMEEMIASVMTQVRQSSDDAQLRSELAMLGESVSSIRDAIDQLPGRFPADLIESRLETLAGSIEALADTEDRSLARHFGEIDSRLDEITRALVAVSTTPGDTDAFERIEARIASLAKTVEHIAEERQDSAALPAAISDGFASEIKSALEAIDHRLADLDRAPPDAQSYETIVSHLAVLSDKLDNVPGLNAAANMAHDDELLSRLDAIAGRLDSFGAADMQGGDGSAFATVERQMAQLVARFDEFAAAGRRETGEGGDNAGIAAMLQDLAGRIDRLAEVRPEQASESEQLARLEQQLGGIVSQLDSFSVSGPDLAPLNERLDSIEQQVAHSRDIAIDVASQAAERAIGMASGGSGLDPELIESLRGELHDLNSSSRDISVRNVAAFETVHEALSVIVDRLGDIEARLHDADTVSGSARSAMPADDRPYERDETGYDERAGHAESHHASGARPAPTRFGEPEDEFEDRESSAYMPVAAPSSHDDDDDYDRGDDRDRDEARDEYHDRAGHSGGHGHDLPSDLPPDLQKVEDAPSLETDELSHDEDEPAEAEPVEDVPLEPGSGAPDFASLVRQAAAKRKSGDASSHARDTSDLISAARRAAQAAAVEAETTKAEKEKKPKEKKASNRAAALRKPLPRPVRLALYVAAIVAIAAFAAPYAMKFLNRPAEVSSVAPETGTADEVASGDIGQSANEVASAKLGDRPAGETGPAAMGSSDGDGTAAATQDSSSPVSEAGMAPQAADPVRPVVTPAPAESAEAEIPAPPEEIGNIALRQAAESGDGAALFEVARRYTDGDPVERDLVKAAQWYEYSARAGFAPAQYRLGNFFEKGHGVASDVNKAVLWYQRAAEQGNALAMHNLAVLYTSGLVGGKPDMETAVEWFKRAAELGVKDSQVNLGILYTRGMGVKEDLVEAYKWFAVAASAGDSDAANKRDMLANAMRPDQLEKARGLAGLWKPSVIDASANSVTIKPEWTVDVGRSADATSGRAEDVATSPISARQMIERAQTLLSALGFDAGPSDGVMGERTREAVRAFQRRTGMKVDGEITGDLIAALERGTA